MFLTSFPMNWAGTGPILRVKVCHSPVTATGVFSSLFCSPTPGKKPIGRLPCSIAFIVSCGPPSATEALASKVITYTLSGWNPVPCAISTEAPAGASTARQRLPSLASPESTLTAAVRLIQNPAVPRSKEPLLSSPLLPEVAAAFGAAACTGASSVVILILSR